jgi:hypothetical protein
MPGNDLGIDLSSVANGLVTGTGGTGSVQGWNNLRTILQSIIDDLEAKVVPGEIDMSANLDFQSAAGADYRAVNVAGVQFADLASQPSAAADVGLLYEYEGNLWFNDSNQNPVRITLNGALDITSTGQISGMTGSAAVVYTGGGTDEYAFTDHNGYPAGIDAGPRTFKEQATAITNGVTLKSPSGLASSFDLLLPAAQSAADGSLMTVSTAGQMATTRDPTMDTVSVSGVAALNGGARFRASGNGNETLDTFEDVGSYTPVLRVSGAAQSPDTINGWYCRIGSMVMVSIEMSDATGGFGNGRYTVTLPYDADITSNCGSYAGSVAQCSIGGTDYDSAVCLIDDQATDDPDGNVSIIPNAGDTINTQLTSGSGASVLKLSICYLTDAAAD